MFVVSFTSKDVAALSEVESALVKGQVEHQAMIIFMGFMGQVLRPGDASKPFDFKRVGESIAESAQTWAREHFPKLGIVVRFVPNMLGPGTPKQEPPAISEAATQATHPDPVAADSGALSLPSPALQEALDWLKQQQPKPITHSSLPAQPAQKSPDPGSGLTTGEAIGFGLLAVLVGGVATYGVMKAMEPPSSGAPVGPPTSASYDAWLRQLEEDLKKRKL